MKRAIALFLMLLMVGGLLIGCSKKGDEADETDGNTVTTVNGDSEVPYDPAIDDLDFDGMEITFLVSNFVDVERKEFFGEAGSTDRVVAAIYNRNMAVEEKLGVKLTFIESDFVDIQEDARNVYNSQDPTVDIYGAYEVFGMALAAEGIYYNLFDVSYLNPESSWWNQSWNESVVYGNQLYGVVGDINTTVITKIQATFVNNDILAEQFKDDVPDLYKVVEDNKWTIEYVKQLCKGIYVDNGLEANTRDMLDRYGLVLGPISQPSQALLTACGYQWTTMGDDGRLDFTLDTEHNLDIIMKIQSLFEENNDDIFITDELPGVYYYATIFTKNNTLMAMAPMFTAEQLAATDISYSILPIPKYDDDQESYYSNTQDSHTFCAVSSISDAKHAVGAVLEYMGYLSERDITPEYFETFYKSQYASDVDTMKMFDRIVDNVHFDFVVNWSRACKDVMVKIRLLACNPLKDPASEIESFQSSCQVYLDEGVYDRLDGLYGE